jgi:hypothetical protein
MIRIVHRKAVSESLVLVIYGHADSGMTIDADGYYAYHPDNKSGLDYLRNAGKPGNWWALVTDNDKPSGNPVIQTKSDPAPGFYVSMTSLEDPSMNSRDPRRYVNAESVNFFVLPSKLGLGAKLGDLGVTIRPDQSDYDLCGLRRCRSGKQDRRSIASRGALNNFCCSAHAGQRILSFVELRLGFVEIRLPFRGLRLAPRQIRETIFAFIEPALFCEECRSVLIDRCLAKRPTLLAPRNTM